MHTCTHAHTHTRTQTHTQARTHTHMHTYMHTQHFPCIHSATTHNTTHTNTHTHTQTHTHTHTHHNTPTHTEDNIIIPQGEASNLNRSDTDVKPMSPFIARSHSCQQWLPSGRVRTACTLGSQGSKSWSYQATYSARTLRGVNSEQISLVQTLTKE